jgi:S1-C subfamily serine protease
VRLFEEPIMNRPQSAARVATLLACIGALAAALLWPSHDSIGRTDAGPRAIAPRTPLAADETANIDVFKRISPSVVHITTLTTQREMFSRNVQQVPRGTGTGFVWDEQGHIVTNFHVIQGGSGARVTLNDQSSYSAQLVGAFPERDLAVLRINAARDKLPPIPIGTSRDLIVGQRVYAIGNPFGLDWSLSAGIVSALDRALNDEDGNTIDHLIQTDAAINPGNSGGPLLDSAGRLIGVNTAIYSPSGASAGIGFAVPIDTVNRVVPELIQHGKYTRPSLGVEFDDGVNDVLASRLNVEGVFVLKVTPDGPAAAAGLRAARIERGNTVVPGDVIVALGGRPVPNVSRLLARLDDFNPGDRLKVTVLREGKRIDVDITLASGK